MAKNLPIQHLHSATPGNIPSALAVGQIAVNSADRSIYTFDGTNIIELERDIFRLSSPPASPSTGDVWYDTTKKFYQTWDGTNWIPLIYAGPYSLPVSVTSSVGFTGGTGTSADPYVYAGNFVRLAGVASQYLDTITVTGLVPNQLIELQDLNGSTNDGRFTFSNNVTSSTGELTFSVYVSDTPKSASGTTLTLPLTLGSVTTYITMVVELIAVFPQTINYPTNTLSVKTPWITPDNILTSSGCILISTDNVTFNQGPLNVTQGTPLYTKWDGAPGSGVCIDGAHGATINGVITDQFGATDTGSLVIDKEPDAFTFVDVTGVGISTTQTSNTVTISGINSYVYPTTTGSGDMSIDGGGWVAGPAAPSSTIYGINGSVLQVRQNASASYTTAVDMPVTISSASDTYTVTTSANIPAVAPPTISTPIADSTGLSKTLVITSSAYAPINGAGAHTSSDWEIYSDAGLTTLVTSSIASTTNLVSWSPTGLTDNTSYWVRVRHTSSDPITSLWSAPVKFTTEQIVLNLEISVDYWGLIPSDNVTKNFKFSKLANEAFIAHFGLDDTCDPPVFLTPSTGITYICNHRSDVISTKTPRSHYETNGDTIIDSGDNAGSQISSLPSYKDGRGAGQTIVVGTVGSTGNIDIKLNGAKFTDSVLFIKVPASFVSASKQVLSSKISGYGSISDETLTFVAPHSGYYIAFMSVDIASAKPIKGKSLPLLDANYYPKITAIDNTTSATIVTGSNLPLVITDEYNKGGGIIMHQVMFKATAGNNISVKLTKPRAAVAHAGFFFTVVGFDA